MFYGLGSEKEKKLFNQVIGMLSIFYGRVFHADHLITIERCMGFFDDPVFTEAFKKAAQSPQDESLAWRVHTLAWAAQHCLHMEGDFVECGVYKGFSSFFLTTYLNFSAVNKSFYLYDTFAGIPEAYREGSPVPEEGYAECGLYEQAMARFAPFANVKVIQGVVPDSLQAQSPEKIAFMHIDMNSARAEVEALEVLFDRVVPGGMIVLDDYGWQWYRAQKEAEDQFLNSRGYSVLEIPTGQGLVIKR